jgi:hypothetical protein
MALNFETESVTTALLFLVADNYLASSTIFQLQYDNVHSVKKDTKRSSVLLLDLVSFFMERTLSK